ncbi:MAG: 3-dehydroquinate synthase [Bacteroidetes bacterium]|nr:3-dehydroquinate synthase [Bacteroidota bacterium]
MKKFSNRIVTTDRTPIFFGSDSLSFIDGFVRELHPRSTFLLVDHNTRKHCLPLLLENSKSLKNAHIIEIEGGEAAKSLENAEKIWNRLLISGAERNSLLINLGGGVISDLGGFVAAGFKRGISYINIPTSLMGQADAAIGGKTAVNLGHLKNQIGSFYAAKSVFICSGFLKTLPLAHLRSGLAEIIKTTLISDATIWHKLLKHPVTLLLREPIETGPWHHLIAGTVKYKNSIVMQDYRERKIRKVLNFGHTIGHALEGYSQSKSAHPLMHGDAVAAGIICAAFLSHQKAGLPMADLEAITKYITAGFPYYPVDAMDVPALMELMIHDKKNNNGVLLFTLISKPGYPLINQTINKEDILEAFAYYNSCQAGSEQMSGSDNQ